MSTSGRAAALFSALLLLGIVATDWIVPGVSSFWSGHAMLTNLVSSLAFFLLTITFVDHLLARGKASRREAVTLVAYNAIARAPMGQRRLMWLLTHGEFLPDPDFQVPCRCRRPSARPWPGWASQRSAKTRS